jgi:hypothetical protein
MRYSTPRSLALLLAATVASGCSGASDDPVSAYGTYMVPQQVWGTRTAPGTIHLEWQQPAGVSGVTGYRVRYESAAAQSARTVDLGPEARSFEIEGIDDHLPTAILVSAIIDGSEGDPQVALFGESQAGEHVTSRTPARIYSCGSRTEGLEIRWFSAPNEAGLVDFEVRSRMMGDANWSSQIVDPNGSDRGYEFDGHIVRRAPVPIPDIFHPIFIELVARYDDGTRTSRSMVWHHLARAASHATPPMPPVNTTVTRVDSTSVRVTWTRTPSTGPIEYRVYAYGNDCEHYGEVVVPGVDAGTAGVVLRDLEPGKHSNYYVHSIRHGVESDPEVGQLHE